MIHSKVLGESIEINAERSGPSAYTSAEIAVLMTVKASDQAMRDIHRIKKHFNGEIAGATTLPQTYKSHTWHGTSWATPVL